MKINELKRIAEENDYEFSKEYGDLQFKKRNHTNRIDISGDYENRIWISISIACDDKDFNMIKASVEFAETPTDERGEEETYYLVKFSEKEIEEIKKKFNTDFSDFELVEVEE